MDNQRYKNEIAEETKRNGGKALPHANGKVPKQSSKKTKDPNAPKKPLTPFFAYMQSRRVEIKAETPNMPATELTAKVALEWNAMTHDQKMSYK